MMHRRHRHAHCRGNIGLPLLFGALCFSRPRALRSSSRPKGTQGRYVDNYLPTRSSGMPVSSRRSRPRHLPHLGSVLRHLRRSRRHVPRAQPLQQLLGGAPRHHPTQPPPVPGTQLVGRAESSRLLSPTPRRLAHVPYRNDPAVDEGRRGFDAEPAVLAGLKQQHGLRRLEMQRLRAEGVPRRERHSNLPPAQPSHTVTDAQFLQRHTRLVVADGAFQQDAGKQVRVEDVVYLAGRQLPLQVRLKVVQPPQVRVCTTAPVPHCKRNTGARR